MADNPWRTPPAAGTRQSRQHSVRRCCAARRRVKPAPVPQPQSPPAGSPTAFFLCRIEERSAVWRRGAIPYIQRTLLAVQDTTMAVQRYAHTPYARSFEFARVNINPLFLQSALCAREMPVSAFTVEQRAQEQERSQTGTYVAIWKRGSRVTRRESSPSSTSSRTFAARPLGSGVW